MNAIKCLCLSALVLFAAACGPSDECEIGQKRDCYTGPAGTSGVGPCLTGSQACKLGKWDECRGEVLPAAEACDGADNDCNGEVDNDVKNACGGCAPITDQPGGDCANCGSFSCDGLEALKCDPPTPAPGATCVADNGCAGAFACGGDRAVTCVATVEKNECGVCGGPALPTKDAACTAENACAGVNVCDEAGTALVCNAPVKNECGICGGIAVAGVGDACTADNTCEGLKTCSTDGLATVCFASVQPNACGLCGGPALTGAVGDACTGENTCGGALACNDTKNAFVCNAPAKNNCGVCGAVDVATVGDACALDGCAGTNACNATSDGVTCSAPAKNACGLCGGPALTGAVGDACTGENTCAGVLACNTAKDAYTCTAPAKNNCGVCGAADVATVGDACTAGGCPGTNACNTTKDGVVCNAQVKNECGLCAGPAVPNLSGDCAAANTCEGHLECNDTDDGSVCVTAIVTNACGVCGGPAITGLNAACTTTEGAPGTYVCGPTGAGVCRKNVILISEISTAGPAGASDEFVELYNPNPVAVDVSNYVLYYRSATSTSAWTTGTRLGVFVAGTTMPPHSYFLFAHADYAGTPVEDKLFTTNGLSGTGAQIWLIDNATLPAITITPADPTVSDMVGFGSADKFEGTKAPVHPTNGSLERKAKATSDVASMSAGGADVAKGNGYDTNDNAANFVLQTVRNPQSSASTAETP